METFVKKLDYKENHSIIGDDDQLLQVLLFKFDSFVTKKEYLIILVQVVPYSLTVD